MTGPAVLISPMLATLGTVPTGPGWAYEFKWDGVRAITYLQSGGLWVYTRNDRDVTGTYPELAELTALLGRRQVILDGEIVALDPGGRPSFAQLPRRMHVVHPTASLLAAVPVGYYVFDVLHLDGEPVLHLPYRQRRDLLAKLPLTGTAVQVPDHFVEADPAQVSAAAARRGLEGVVAKRLTSPYRPGRRSPDWIKTPINRTQEVVIIGYRPGGPPGRHDRLAGPGRARAGRRPDLRRWGGHRLHPGHAHPAAAAAGSVAAGHATGAGRPAGARSRGAVGGTAVRR
jgi:bifunctional non-homologous end joining protein LigD